MQPSALPLDLHASHRALAQAAAQRILDAIEKKLADPSAQFTLGLATGGTMEPVYEALVPLLRSRRIDVSRLRFTNLDEYSGISPQDAHSYRHYLWSRLLTPIGARPENVHLMPSDPDFDGPKAEAFEAKIAEWGGIDLQLLGIGRDGHLGFNSPPADPDGRSRRVTLSEITREDNAAYFGGMQHMPRAANTMGLGTLMEHARSVLLLTNGRSKARILAQSFDPTGHGEISEQEQRDLGITPETRAAWIERGGAERELPARILHRHPDARVLADTAAAGMLGGDVLRRHTDLRPSELAALLDARAPIDFTVQVAGVERRIVLPHHADIFIPGAMKLDERFDPGDPRHRDAFAEALERTEASYVGAHQDDTEIAVPHELQRPLADGAFQPLTAVIATDGAMLNNATSADNPYAGCISEEFAAERVREQRTAALHERYGMVVQLGYPSAALKGELGEEASAGVSRSLSSLFRAMPNHARAYGHQPFDNHETHVGVYRHWVEALRDIRVRAQADEAVLPAQITGMEGWGTLGHLPESLRESFPVPDPDRVRRSLLHYKTQIYAQGRNYDTATDGRVRGNAGFTTNHHAKNPPPGMSIGIDVSRAVTHGLEPLALCEAIGAVAARVLKERLGKLSSAPIAGERGAS